MRHLLFDPRFPFYLHRSARWILLMILLGGATALGSCKTIPAGANSSSEENSAGTVVWLTVVGISDYHGALAPEVIETGGGASVPVGGAALLSAYLGRIRDRAPGPTLLLDAGDMFQGTLASGLFEGAPVITLYNHLGVAAAAVGNHEFDFGPVGPDAVPRAAGDDPRGALKARIAEADFPFLAANLRDASGQVPAPFAASHLMEVGGMKIGLLGLASAATASTTVGKNLEGLTVVEPLPVAIAEARRLRKAGAARVIVIFHGGSACDPAYGEGLKGCEVGELLRLVEGLPAGLVDLVLGGHTHGRVARRVGSTVVLQGGARGTTLSWAELPVKGAPVVHPPVSLCGATVATNSGPSCARGALEASAARPVPARFLGEAIVADAKVATLVEAPLRAAREQASRLLGVEVSARIPRAYGEESPLGNLVADAFLAAVPEARIGITNGGGLRSDLPAGPLSWGAVFQVLPFDNHLAVMEVLGSTIERIIQHGLRSGHGALSFSGLSYRARGCELLEVLVGGAPIDPTTIYRVVTSDYLAEGGSGFDTVGIPVAAVNVLWTRPLLREILAEFVSGRGGPLAPEDFFTRSRPRQQREGVCEAVRKAGS